MRHTFMALALLACSAAPVAAQDAKDLQAKYEKKINSDWFKANPWTADYDEARAQAAKSGKVIFAYFTRSYSY